MDNDYVTIQRMKMWTPVKYPDPETFTLIEYGRGSADASSTYQGHDPRNAFELGTWTGSYCELYWLNLKFIFLFWLNCQDCIIGIDVFSHSLVEGKSAGGSRAGDEELANLVRMAGVLVLESCIYF